MILKKILFSVISLLMVTLLYQCKHDPDLDIYNGQDPNNPTTSDACDPDSVYFQNYVLPLLVSNCSTSGCHDKESAEDGVILVDYASVMGTGEIKTGNPGDSELYEKIMENDPEERMPPPPNNSLTADQRNMIKKWIEQGAKNNSCDSGCDTLNVTFSTSVWPTLSTNCVGCHSGAEPSGNITITDYNSVVALANNGSLLSVIKHEGNYSPMPKNGQKLSDCKVAEIKIWIEDGTPNN